MAEPIVPRALVRIGEHFVGFGGFLEPGYRFGIARIGVRMELDRQLAIRRGNLPLGSSALDAEDFVRRDAIQALMCGFALDWSWLARRRGVDGARHFAPELAALAPLAEAGAVRIDESGVTVLPRGRLLVRAVAMAFDRHLAAGERPAGGYSRIA